MDRVATCRCGKVRLEAIGRPILTASCYCTSCQDAGHRLDRLLDADGGTGMTLYRKDRVQRVTGRRHLEEHRLKPDSPTRRVVATCCNSAMFLDFTKGHWVSIYRDRFPTGAPPTEMRVMTGERRAGAGLLPDDVPNHRGHSVKFMLKLVAAWMAMGFRRPQLPI